MVTCLITGIILGSVTVFKWRTYLSNFRKATDVFNQTQIRTQNMTEANNGEVTYLHEERL